MFFWGGKAAKIFYIFCLHQVAEIHMFRLHRESSHGPEFGAIAQLGERYNGIVEAVGSIPSGSTNF